MNGQGSFPVDTKPRVKDGKAPFLPPEDGRCLINELPPEILSYIFELGAFGTYEADEDFHAYIDNLLGDFIKKRDEERDEESGCDEEQEHMNIVNEDSASSQGSWETEQSETDDSARSGISSQDEFEDSVEFEVLVSHVCKRWRDIALANPSLWSCIVFDGGLALDKNRTYLDRAKSVPLEIQLDCTIDDEDRDEEEDVALSNVVSARDHPKYIDVQKFLDLVKPHASHFQVLEVMVSHWLLMQLVLETFASCPAAPMLEVLQLYFHEEADASSTFEPAIYREQDFVLFEGNIPKLKCVALWGVHLNWERSTFLTGLTELELAYHPVDVRPPYCEFLRMLQTSPALRCLSLCASGPLGTPVDWLESVMEGGTEATQALPLSLTLPITSLVLAFIPPNYIFALLERLSVPHVRRLTLDFDEDDYTEVLQRFSTPGLGGVPRRSLFAGLDSLKIIGMPCTDESVIAKALSEMQSVRDLNLNFNHVPLIWHRLLCKPEEVISISENVSERRVYCPRLETFFITGVGGRDLKTLVSERSKRGYPLKKLFINMEDVVDVDTEEWLQENLEVFDYFEGSDDEDAEDDDMFPFGWDEEDEEVHFSDMSEAEDDYDDDENWMDEDEDFL